MRRQQIAYVCQRGRSDDVTEAQLKPCAPQLFDALVNRSIVRATGEHYGMIERC